MREIKKICPRCGIRPKKNNAGYCAICHKEVCIERDRKRRDALAKIKSAQFNKLLEYAKTIKIEDCVQRWNH